MKISILKSSPFLLATAFAALSFALPGDPWVVPDKNAKTPNPIKTSAQSIADGKALWAKNCQSCHGKAGEGDGSKAAQLKTLPPSFASADFQKQPDGAIFYKTSEGRGDMPSFKKKLPDAEDIWNLVNYMRTFKK
ncbi:Cytochrome C oxidase, cbb3-type, subunit III [Chitinophaga costaii]|uniref:Cytochrome C oxidase, cbb3-type, subunit III n=1 Tax=Chitinophaga costaii TaxID=1335309 RepID=A0A1C4CWP6_9BACT|nr:cytochrome c [Chitinophaga costaii]PUZ26915.1 cytochrome c [Chitinophaga costaii]SCC23418.1 Cytochrome C oxidase, cbb3-type, subunit III [Chitinophaga costaii]